MLSLNPTYEILDREMSDSSDDYNSHRMREVPSPAVPRDYKYGWQHLAADGEEVMAHVDELNARISRVELIQGQLRARDWRHDQLQHR